MIGLNIVLKRKRKYVIDGVDIFFSIWLNCFNIILKRKRTYTRCAWSPGNFVFNRAQRIEVRGVKSWSLLTITLVEFPTISLHVFWKIKPPCLNFLQYPLFWKIGRIELALNLFCLLSNMIWLCALLRETSGTQITFLLLQVWLFDTWPEESIREWTYSTFDIGRKLGGAVGMQLHFSQLCGTLTQY